MRRDCKAVRRDCETVRPNCRTVRGHCKGVRLACNGVYPGLQVDEMLLRGRAMELRYSEFILQADSMLLQDLLELLWRNELAFFATKAV